MSNKSGVAESVISLPTGGGALRGMGETFAPDLHTGTGNLTVPLELPPGRNGFQPALSLVYSTGNGNGLFGMGWTLSIPGVARQTRRGVPRYFDDDPDPARRDTFVLSGAEDLVAVETVTDGAGRHAVRYRPRTEGLFAHIWRRRSRDERYDYWEVRTKDGSVTYYGTNPAAGEHPAVDSGPLEDAAVVVRRSDAGPEAAARIFAWKPTLTKDAFGNRIEYLYAERDRSTSADERDGRTWNQPLLTHIRYVDHGDADQRRFLVYVTLEYEERPDPFSEYRAGFEIHTARRCKAIHIDTRPIENGTERTISVRRYEVRYSNEPLNGASTLTAVEVVGFDDRGRPVRELPPLTFAYTPFAPAHRRDFFPVTGDLPAGSLARADHELADLTGNGLPDVVQINGVARYWRNLGGGRFDVPRLLGESPPFALADPGVQLIDADGDGRIDLLVTSGASSGYFPLNHTARWDPRSFARHAHGPSFGLDDPDVRLVDLNGDGVTDAIRSASRLECYFNDPQRGWDPAETRVVPRAALDVFPDVAFSDPRVRLGDMSGDGLQDVVMIHDGSVEYWPNHGWGNWGRRIQMKDSPRFPHGYDPRRVLVGDVDGDGLADIVYVDDRSVTVWVNRSGNGWSAPIQIHGTPRVTDMDAVRLVDLRGSGVSGVLWSADADGTVRHHMHFLDLTGGGKPYLLNAIDNHLGAETMVEYASSTDAFLADDARPSTRWRTSLPFPVQVVKRVEVVDRLSQTKLTTEYRYHHGHWDGAEREFRGFGMVEQLDSEALLEFNAAGMHGTGAAYRVNDEAFSPPVLKKTWFHQGPIGPEHGEWRDSDHTADCWAGDPGRFEGHIVVTSVSRDSPDGRRVMRDAVRALRGMELRTELYMLDGSAREPRPYTVTETRYGVRDVEPPPSGQARRRVFFPHRLDQRVTHWERGDDPMTQVTLVDDYDDFGQPREETSVALPRRSTARGPAPGTPGPDEARVLATYARRDYASPGDPVVYLHDRECQARTFELREPRLVQEQAADDVVRVIDDQVAAAMGLRAAFRAALGGWSAGQPLPGAVRLVQHTINYYDGAAFEGLGAGVVGHYGALTRRETLVLTDELLDASYGGRRPVYLGGTAEAPAGAPAGFGHDAGYRRRSNSGAGHHAGYYADTLRRRYDFQSSPAGGGRGLAEAERNPLGHTSTIGFDDFQWLPVSVVDAVRLETRARQNYRTFQPASIVDPNRNVVEVEYSPLGLAAATWIKGKPEEIEGDRERPSTRYEYDFRAFERSGRPIAVRTIRHVHHDTDARAESSARDDVIETREFSDGFGRLIQVRSQAEDVTFGDSVFGHGVVALVPDERADRAPVIGTRNGDAAAPTVVVGGWQRYDNKGRVIETFEPYFDRAWDYAPPTADQVGRSVRVRYDPRGRAVCTVNPDGSLQRVIFGAPRDARNLALSESDLASVDVPASFVPTPWEAYTYDANDLASVSRDPNGHTLAGRAPVHHRFTPDSTLMDGLGRVVRRVARSGSDAAGWLTTRMAYDTRGNLVDVHDPLGRRAFAYAYDLLDRPLAVVAIDAGTRTSVPDAAGNVIETRDGRGGVVLRQYDPANRLVRLWARNDAAAALTLRGHVAYGDDGDRDAARERNALGRPVEHRDEAGVQRFVRYDFKRQLTDKVRQTIGDSALADGWQPDWSAQDADQRLDPREYQTSTRYDALSRIVELTCPADAGGIRRGVTPAYNRAGALERVSAGGEVYVDRIAYNARGQRTLVLYSNGLMTRYAYDARTFRLARLRTERFSASQDLEYRPDGGVLQDLAHAYDLAGNIIAITDRTPGSGVRGHVESDVTDTALRALLAEGDALVRRFDYDPLYRLVRATGREAINIASPRPPADDARNGFNSGNHGTPNQDNAPNLTAAYWESYAYDPAGNLVELKHGSPRAPTWSRHFGVGGRTPGQWAAEWPARLNASATWPDAPGNRLTHVGDDTVDAPQTHYFDDGGHLTREHTERRLSWDHAGQLIGFTVQPRGSTTASIRARYLYGADGMRVKKWVRRGGGRDESIVYIDGVFEHHRWSHGQAQGENTHLHVMDRQSRVAVIRVGDRHPDDGGEPVQYHFGDHLGSSALVVGGAGAASRTFVSREEYLPYGETSFGCFGRKRYRFSARERDEESGFLYCGARYLVPWLNRWASCDPAGPADHLNAYTYARCSPLVLVDPHGRQAGPPPDQEIVFEEVNIVGTSMDVPEALRARREAARLGWSDYEQMYDQEFHRLWDEQRRQEDMEQLKVYGAITGIVAAGALGGELVGAGALGVATALELGSLSTGILVGASSGAATVASTDLAEMGFGRDITPATFGTEVLAGAIFGGILGGVLGAVLGGRRPALPPAEASPRSFRLPGDRVGSFMRVGEGFDIQVKGPEGLSRFRSSFAHMEGSELVVEHAEIVLGKPHAVGARSLMQMRDAIGRQLADIYGADSVLFTPTARTGSGATRAGAALRQSDAARWTRESGRFSRVKE